MGEEQGWEEKRRERSGPGYLLFGSSLGRDETRREEEDEVGGGAWD